MRITRLKAKLDKVIAEKGVVMDPGLAEDLQQVMAKEEEQALGNVEPGSFQHIFGNSRIKQQLAVARKGMRWNPAMIEWCLFLRHQSSKAYEMIRQSGCIHLPSQRTLMDYTHCTESGAGFSLS